MPHSVPATYAVSRKARRKDISKCSLSLFFIYKCAWIAGVGSRGNVACSKPFPFEVLAETALLAFWGMCAALGLGLVQVKS